MSYSFLCLCHVQKEWIHNEYVHGIIYKPAQNTVVIYFMKIHMKCFHIIHSNINHVHCHHFGCDYIGWCFLKLLLISYI